MANYCREITEIDGFNVTNDQLSFPSRGRETGQFSVYVSSNPMQHDGIFRFITLPIRITKRPARKNLAPANAIIFPVSSELIFQSPYPIFIPGNALPHMKQHISAPRNTIGFPSLFIHQKSLQPISNESIITKYPIFVNLDKLIIFQHKISSRMPFCHLLCDRLRTKNSGVIIIFHNMCQFLFVPGPPMHRTFLKKNWYKIGAVPSRKRRAFRTSGRLLPTFPGSSPGSPVIQLKPPRNSDMYPLYWTNQ